MLDRYNKVEWEIYKFNEKYCYCAGEYKGKYYIELQLTDIDAEDATDIYQEYWDDEDIASKLKMELIDYIFNMAKYGKAQKLPKGDLYWDSEEDAQSAIDWLESLIVMGKLCT